MRIATFRDDLIRHVQRSDAGSVATLAEQMRRSEGASRRHIARILDDVLGGPAPRDPRDVTDAEGNPVSQLVAEALDQHTRRSRSRVLFGYRVTVAATTLLVVNDRRGERWWIRLPDHVTSGQLTDALERLVALVGQSFSLIPHGELQAVLRDVAIPDAVTLVDWAHRPLPYQPTDDVFRETEPREHAHLAQLEAESIRIIREAVAAARKPGMLFSMGKDSMVMWTLARKAFWPEPPPFPLVIIDTRWKFQDMYRFRHWIENRPDTDVIVHINPDGIRDEVNPFDFGSAVHTDIMKTHALKQVLDAHQFDFVFGGARRDEEKSRAKERVFSLRNAQHGWDPKNQRPELWNLYNTRLMPGQSMRVFPLSNWTELDIWRYVQRERIDVVPLYFSKVRPFVERNGSLIMVDDDRFRLDPGEKIHFKPIRFRTLGCYPLTGGVRSHATTVSDIIRELEETRVSERSSRVIDFDPGASMEQKKKEGYF